MQEENTSTNGHLHPLFKLMKEKGVDIMLLGFAIGFRQ